MKQIINYRIYGALQENNSGKFLSKKELKEKPPVLELFNQEGYQQAYFELTEDCVHELAHHLRQLDRVYKGLVVYHTQKDLSIWDRLRLLPQEFRLHKWYFLVLGFALSLFILSYLLP